MTNASTIFMALFGGIFFLVGLAVLISGLSDIGASENGDQWVDVAMGSVFASVGGGIIWLALRSRVAEREQAAERKRYPSEPWKWDRRWTTRRIEHHGGWTAVAFWGFAIIWNAIVISAGLLGWEEMAGQIKQEPAVLFVLLFPIVGVGVLIAAIRATLQWRRYGTSAFVLERSPVSLGRPLEGVLELPSDVRNATEIVAALTCLRTTRSGKNTTTTVVWSDERRYPHSSIGVGPSGPTLPISIRVPSDEPETSVGSGYPSIRWELSVAAAVEGVDFSASFPLPVFRTSETPAPGSVEENESDRPRLDRASGLLERTIVRERTADGAATWNYPAMRAPKAAIFLTGFTIVWSAILWLMATNDAPGIVIAIFGFFEILLIMGTADVLLGRVTVTIDRSGMFVQYGVGTFLRTRRVVSSDVERLRVKGGMTVGSTMYHAIVAQLSDGKNVPVGKYLRSRLEAEAIVEEMEQELKRR